MSLPVVLRPLANADVQQIHAELEAQALGLGDKFLDRLQEALERIEAMPEMYAKSGGRFGRPGFAGSAISSTTSFSRTGAR